MIVLIDNYDSFVYNLARYLDEMGCCTKVLRNDRTSVAEIESLNPAAVVISPGPCTPHEAGISVAAVRELGCRIPILGVCLGHQAIGAALGVRIVRAPEPVHGRTSQIHHIGERLFAGLPNPLRATRYHSLIIDETSLPDALSITARSEDGLPMAIQHRVWPLFGVQFHPESILTDCGHRLLANFLEFAGAPARAVPPGDFVARTDGEDFPLEVGRTHIPLHW
jgi:anthranilate synthase/aminodeoxychorismate synthase-like glutamine amidotransferase